jgi:hypothetical protein
MTEQVYGFLTKAGRAKRGFVPIRFIAQEAAAARRRDSGSKLESKLCSLLLTMQQLVLSDQFNESGEAFVHLEGTKSNAGDR